MLRYVSQTTLDRTSVMTCGPASPRSGFSSLVTCSKCMTDAFPTLRVQHSGKSLIESRKIGTRY